MLCRYTVFRRKWSCMKMSLKLFLFPTYSLSIVVSYIVTHMYAGEQTEGMKNAWKKTRVDRMLVDHFLRAGHYSAALRLAESSGIEVGEEGVE